MTRACIVARTPSGWTAYAADGAMIATLSAPMLWRHLDREGWEIERFEGGEAERLTWLWESAQ